MRIIAILMAASTLASCEVRPTAAEDANDLEAELEATAEAAENAIAEADEAAKDIAANDLDGSVEAADASNGVVPLFDTASYCRQIGDTAGGSYQIERTCRDMEDEARAAIAGRSFPARVARYCTEIGETAGGSYQIMNTCIDMELEAM